MITIALAAWAGCAASLISLLAVLVGNMRLLDCALFAAVTLSAYCAPYTKVEESFYVQAVHDILKWGRVNDAFDHFAFPGVVPRSFVGPLAISALTYPITAFLGKLNDSPSDTVTERISTQLLSRLVLGLLVVWANSRLRSEIRRIFGRRTAMWYGIFCCCQFHYTFWTSRMLGNTMALVPMLLAQKHWLRCMCSTSRPAKQRSYQIMAAVLIFTSVVLRFDIAVFAAVMLVSSATSITWRAVSLSATALVASVLLTLLVDSYYWQTRWMWPEFQAFWFNVVRGQSVEWGTSPAHYYLIRALPRLLLGALPFSVVGMLRDTRAARLVGAYAVAVAVFSANPHKEWRFILPSVPVLNICAAVGVSELYQIVSIRRFVTVFAMLLAGSSLCIALAMTYISSLNYPGGHALASLHAIEQMPRASVHIDAYSAMTGVTRFGQYRTGWKYDKSEDLMPSQYQSFTHLLSSRPEQHINQGFKVIDTQSGYVGLQATHIRGILRTLASGQFALLIRQAPLVWIMRRDDAQNE
ncbi:alpha-1,6- mannosyltransferase [Coemansia guatemalensis]|uniref:Mannosyltransferase n=1 Tax=Coemansia guatemalensis TaxID=2761395 RepID=A0A9W8I0K9_9FUNG|nr:alpha-1,6- mannosyltransferase [Coemansia guatemalensis]